MVDARALQPLPDGNTAASATCFKTDDPSAPVTPGSSLPAPTGRRKVRPMASSSRLIPTVRLIAVLTLGSRVLGLARECLFGYFFSTTECLSAFRIAFMAPNLARRLFGEGALSSAMIPVLTEAVHADGETSSRRFVGALLTVLTLVLIGIIVLVEIGIAVWRAARDDLALQLAAILMPYMALICMVAVASAVLNVRRHFATPAAAPAILNLILIAAMVGGGVAGGLTGVPLMIWVCVGVLAAGVVQLAATGLALRAVSFFPIFGGSWRDPRVRSVAVLMAPMVLGLSAVQINSLVDYLIAYLFISVDGQRVGPAVLGYAQYLYQLPLGVFGIAVATAMFPELSRKATASDRAGLAQTLVRGLTLSLFIALPASIGLMVVASPLVATLFERGAFDEAATRRVAGALFFYSLGLTAYFAQHLLVRTFYAMHDSRTPARIAMTLVFVNALMNLGLVFVLQERGLALATAVCAAMQVVWLTVRLTRVLPEIPWWQLGRGVARIGIAASFMTAVLVAILLLAGTHGWIGGHAAWHLGILVAAGAGSYALASRALGIEELSAVLRRGRPEPDDDGPGE
jgi:putative peptidoglycan lipid II flippase